MIKKQMKQLSPLLFLLLLIFFPTDAIAGAKSGLMLWYSTVVPTLLPFIMISNLILRSGGMQYFTYLFYPLYLLFPKLIRSLSYVLVIGFFCGYPMGAKTIDDLIKTGQISEKQGQFLLTIANNASPMFIIGYVVVSTLNSSVSIPLFLSFIYLPIVTYSLITLLLNPKLLLSDAGIRTYTAAAEAGGLDDSIMNAFTIVMKIGAYIMLFSIFSNLLLQMNIPFLPLKIVIVGFSEVTTGIKYISQLALCETQKIALIAAVTSFGGLSSIAQTKSVLTASRLSIVTYALSKLLLSALSYGLVLLYYIIL